MPTYSRRQLRQRLGQDHIGDTLVSATTGSCAAGQGAYVIDQMQADLSLSAEGATPYAGAQLRVNGMDLRISGFNCGSGAFVTGQVAGTAIPSGAEYELHEIVSAREKDRALTQTAPRLTSRREYPLPSVDGAYQYSLPDDVRRVLGGWYFANPAGSLDRDRRPLARCDVVTTGSGREVRIQPALGASQQLVLDAIVTLTLGPSDSDTIELPDADWLLFGAEAQCWEMATRAAPGQEATAYRTNARRAASAFSHKSAVYSPQIDVKIQFDTLV